MDEFTFDLAVWGYYVYQDVWKPAAGENLMDKFAVKVTKNSETVGRLPRDYSRISSCWYFLAHGRKICVEVTGRRHNCKQICGGMEIQCRLVFSCSSKVKLNRLKELLENKIHW